MKTVLLSIISTLLVSIVFSQNLHPKFQEYLKKSPDQLITFCVKNDDGVVEFLLKENINIKYQTGSWLFINATPSWLDENSINGNIKQFYFESSPPQLLNDSSRLSRFVDPVHAGAGGLTQAYTGNNVIIGYIDTGLDFNHPDFIDASGNTRVMRIWDQLAAGGANTYAEYGYGILWDSTDINNGTCTHGPSTGHGTHVSGIGSGNGLANGKNKGIAPDSKIVIVGTNLNAANWSLTVADACDYIFKYADSVGLPAVVNISAGNYWGSHDGNDPGSVYMEQLLDEKPGRIIVAAAGNSGAQGSYHVTGNVSTDTTFTWLKNNASNYIYFDLWADTSDAHFDFAFGTDKPAPNYGLRGNTIFRNAQANLGTVIFDTIRNNLGDQIASMQIWTELIDSAYHMEFFMEQLDSTTYKCRFMTRGSGKYNLWSGAWLGGNDLETVIPTSLIVPEIGNYQMPDNNQTMVSGFQCSEKVITVGNFRNRSSYTDFNGNPAVVPANTPENISPNSSKGPNRLNTMKPDISANGDVVLSAGIASALANPANYPKMELGDAWHIRNSGTSMACPLVSGIAALYLEKCPLASFSDFRNDLISTSTTDGFTGAVPNNSYGYGKPHALNLLLGANNVPIIGGPGICFDPVILSTNTYTSIDSIIWSTGVNSLTLSTSIPNNYSADIYYGGGCVAHSETINLSSVVPSTPTVSSTTQPTCIVPTGSINFTPQAGVEYSVGGAYQVSPNFAGLAANTYTLSVRSTASPSCSVNAASTVTLNAVVAPNIDPLPPIIACNSFVLDPITGQNLTGNEAYYSGVGGTGTQYNAGDIITSSVTTLYMYDIDIACFSEVNVNFTINNSDDSSFILNDFCAGQNNSAIITGTQGGVFTFNPLPNDGATVDSNTGSITNGVAGSNYTIEYTTSGNCPTSSLETVNVSSAQVAPIISNANSLLIADFQSNYQWYLNGVAIPGANNQTYVATEPFGVYTLSTGSNGCISTSNSIDLTAGIIDLELVNIMISPNPTTSDFSIKMSDVLFLITATDINGKEVNLLDKGNNNYSISHLCTGTYYLKIITDRGLFRSKIIKM